MQGSRPRATIDDASAYVKAVKETFSDKEEIYNEFLQVMKDFTEHRIDPAVVVARVKKLFKEHVKLLLDINTFLPNGFRVHFSTEEKNEIALKFFNNVKSRLQGDPHVYKSFLQILCMANRKEKTPSEAYDEVAFLLQDHEDLLEEFTIFLPGKSVQHSNSAIETNKNEHKYAVDVSNAENNKLNAESDDGAENCSSSGVTDSSDGQHDYSSSMDTNKNEHKHTVDVSDADNKLNVEGDHDVTDSSEYEIGLKFLQNGFRVTLSPEDKQSRWEIAFNFFKKVASRLQGDYDVYMSFLEIMSMLSREEKTLSEAYEEVAFLLHYYEDLLEEFTIFFPGNSDQHCNSAIGTNKNEHEYAVDVSNAENNKLNVESNHGAENCCSGGMSDSSHGDKCSMPDIKRSDTASFLRDTSDQHGNSVMGTNKNEHKYTVEVSDADNELNVESDHDVTDSSEDEIGLKSVCSKDCEKADQRNPD